MSKSKTVELLPHQIEHQERLLTILENSNIAFDFSKMGEGKTYVSTSIAQVMNFDSVLVICPRVVSRKWKEISDTYNIPLDGVITFEDMKMVNSGNHVTKYVSLTKRYSDDDKLFKFDTSHRHHYPTFNLAEIRDTYKVPIIGIDATNHIISLANKANGLLIIVDESHVARNEYTVTNTTLKKIINVILKNNNKNNKSRVLMMSGTPVDSVKQLELLKKYIVSQIKHTTDDEFDHDSYLHIYRKYLDINNFSNFSFVDRNTSKFKYMMHKSVLHEHINRITNAYRNISIDYYTSEIIDYNVKSKSLFKSLLSRCEDRLLPTDSCQYIQEICIDKNLNIVYAGPLSDDILHIEFPPDVKVVVTYDAYSILKSNPYKHYTESAIHHHHSSDEHYMTIIKMCNILRNVIYTDVKNDETFSRLYGHLDPPSVVINAYSHSMCKAEFSEEKLPEVVEERIDIDDIVEYNSAFEDLLLAEKGVHALKTSSEFVSIIVDQIKEALGVADRVGYNASMACLHITRKAIKRIEKVKIKSIICNIKSEMIKYPDTKFVYVLNNRDNTDLAIKMYGEENATVETFQQRDGPRLFIAYGPDINEGVDLDDKFGDRPRVVYMSPPRSFIDLSQRIYRFLRCNSMSIPTIIYSVGDRDETSIMRSLYVAQNILSTIISRIGNLLPVKK